MGMAAESQFHVLAVDDSRLDLMLVAKLLKRASYNVTTVDSGAKALEFLGFKQDFDVNDADAPTSLKKNSQESEVNLVITDYCMPGMTGYDLLKKIKESSSLRNIPVAIMSSENVPSRITECLEKGAEDFFLKPVKESDLNKLKPHMIRTKLKNQIEKPEFKEADSGKAEIFSRQEQEQHQEGKGQEQKHQGSEHEEQEEENKEKQEEQEQVMNKRKTMAEGLTQDRSRRRYDELTTVVS